MTPLSRLNLKLESVHPQREEYSKHSNPRRKNKLFYNINMLWKEENSACKNKIK